ncbi:MAG TPA: sulfotransferase family 2 domain-containing protein [Rhizomicrobium sp.]|nr:sulfotransferase family 2 domain-containing protein [Rhizomicrobium sp.]
MYSKRFNTIFVHIPKTGGQSIEHVFLAEHGLTWETRAGLLLRRKRPEEKGPPRLAHLYAREYAGLGFVPTEEFDACFKFAVVRNPYDRAVSAWRFRRDGEKAEGPETFPDFIASLAAPDGHRRNREQVRYVQDENGRLIVDRILRFESLASDFAEVSRRIFGRAIELPHVNKSTAAVPAEAGDPGVRRAIFRLYERDFDFFAYPRGF